MRIFVLTATYELRVSRKSHLRDHPNCSSSPSPISKLFVEDLYISAAVQALFYLIKGIDAFELQEI
jgi:hypothetical protein